MGAGVTFTSCDQKSLLDYVQTVQAMGRDVFATYDTVPALGIVLITGIYLLTRPDFSPTV